MGTKIICTSLFHNAPVRKEMHKKNKGSTAKIMKIMYEYAIVHPSMTFKLIKDSSNENFVKQPLSNHLNVLANIYGPHVADTLQEITNPIHGHFMH